MRRWWFILCVILTLPTAAQDNETRHYTVNDELLVTINAASPTRLILANDVAGQVVTITAQAVDSSQLDPVLWVLDSQGCLLAYNNNSGAAQIVNLLLATPGLYHLYVDSFNGVSTGDVAVSIQEADRFNIVIEETGSLHVMRFTLAEDTIFAYPITVQAGDRLTITVRAGNRQLDPVIRIVDSSGKTISSNDDHHSSDLRLNLFDARLANWDVPADDTYILEIWDYLGRLGNIWVEIRKHG
jgi:hypothetical protein